MLGVSYMLIITWKQKVSTVTCLTIETCITPACFTNLSARFKTNFVRFMFAAMSVKVKFYTDITTRDAKLLEF
jgi:hypothetical protein